MAKNATQRRLARIMDILSGYASWLTNPLHEPRGQREVALKIIAAEKTEEKGETVKCKKRKP